MITTPLRLAALALLLSNLPLVSAAPANAGNKPMNVLFLVVDDLNTWLLNDPNRYAGKAIAPKIWRLAAERNSMTAPRILMNGPTKLPIRITTTAIKELRTQVPALDERVPPVGKEPKGKSED